MNLTLKKNGALQLLILFLYAIFFCSFVFRFRAISSISTGLLLVAGIIKQKGLLKKNLFSHKTAVFLASCGLYFLLQLVALLYHPGWKAGLADLQLKSGLVFIPLAVILTGPFNSRTRRTLRSVYCLAVLAASLYCMTVALWNYFDTGDSSVLFYHQLVRPLQQHAVYFSVYTFIALVFLLENAQQKDLMLNNIFHWAAILFLSVFLFLLSSKIVLVFYVFYLINYFISALRRPLFSLRIKISLFIFLLALTTLGLFTHNPVSNRFREIFTGKPGLVNQEKYNPGIYFNDIQFRLLQWKLVPEILSKHKSWWLGTGPGASQDLLDEKYVARNMYLGDPATGDRGYRGYNTHDQLLESLLKNGITGLVLFLFLCYALVRMVLQIKQRGNRFILLLLLVYAFFESVLETQYGIVIFTFFPVFLGGKEDEPTSGGSVTIG